MSRQIGAITTISITTAVIAGAADPATAHAHAYAFWALLLLLAVPVVSRIPEHRGAW
ncbi:MAG: hypothetical protein ACREPF_12565 [Rhodanobacteraceae bacterium]